MSARIIDAHLHVWDRSQGGYDWITPDLAALDRDFAPADAEAELNAAGVDCAILVQAEDSDADTRFMLDVARDSDWVAGVVGWVRLDDEAAAAEALDDLNAEPLLRGIRHLLHDDPRDDFLELPAVRASLARVAAHGLTFDVPDAWPRHLGGATKLARELPALTVVIDHLGKPPVGTEHLVVWEQQLRAAASLPNTAAKFSGLHLPGIEFGTDAIAPLLEIALDAFGADRIMYGGDWPMSVLHDGYQPTWRVMRSCLDALSPSERDAVLGGTAERVYLADEIRPFSSFRADIATKANDSAGNIR